MAAEEDQALADEPVDRVRAVLERIVDELDVDGSVEVSEEEDEIIGRVDGEDLGLLIGRRGQTIDAVQLLCYRAAFQAAPGPQAGHGGRCWLPGSAVAMPWSARPTAQPSGR